MTGMVSIICTVLCGLTLVTAAVTDVSNRRIPNLLTLPAIVLGLFLNLFQPTFFHLLLAIAVLFLVGMLGVLGGGDLKLLMSVTAFMGVMPMLWSVGIASVSILLLELIRYPKQTVHAVKTGLGVLIGKGKPKEQGRRVPFAPYLLFGFTVWLTLSLLIR